MRTNKVLLLSSINLYLYGRKQKLIPARFHARLGLNWRRLKRTAANSHSRSPQRKFLLSRESVNAVFFPLAGDWGRGEPATLTDKMLNVSTVKRTANN